MTKQGLEKVENQVEIEVTPEMIEAGVAILRASFGGETEGSNRLVDFSETVQTLLNLSSTYHDGF